MNSSKPYLLAQLRNDFEIAQSLGSPLLQCQGMLVIDRMSGDSDLSSKANVALQKMSGGRLLIQSAPRPIVSNFDPAEAHYAGGFVGVVPSIPNTKFTGSITMLETETGAVQELAELIVNNGGAIDCKYYDGRLDMFHRVYTMLNMAIRFESAEYTADSKSSVMTVTCPVDYNYFGVYADIGENQTIQAGSTGETSGWHKEVKNVLDTVRAARSTAGQLGGLARNVGSLFG